MNPPPRNYDDIHPILLCTECRSPRVEWNEAPEGEDDPAYAAWKFCCACFHIEVIA